MSMYSIFKFVQNGSTSYFSAWTGFSLILWHKKQQCTLLQGILPLMFNIHCFIKASDATGHLYEPRLASGNLLLWKYRRTVAEEKVSSSRCGVERSWKSCCWRTPGSPPARLLVLCPSPCQVCCCYAASGETGILFIFFHLPSKMYVTDFSFKKLEYTWISEYKTCP